MKLLLRALSTKTILWWVGLRIHPSTHWQGMPQRPWALAEMDFRFRVGESIVSSAQKCVLDMRMRLILFQGQKSLAFVTEETARDFCTLWGHGAWSCAGDQGPAHMCSFLEMVEWEAGLLETVKRRAWLQSLIKILVYTTTQMVCEHLKSPSLWKTS